MYCIWFNDMKEPLAQLDDTLRVAYGQASNSIESDKLGDVMAHVMQARILLQQVMYPPAQEPKPLSVEEAFSLLPEGWDE